MRSLLLYGLNDYSFLTKDNRSRKINVFLLYISTLLKDHNCFSISIDSRDSFFSIDHLKQQIKSNNIDTIIIEASKNNVRSIIRLTSLIDCKKTILVSQNEDLSSFLKERDKIWNYVYDERFSFQINARSFFADFDVEIGNNDLKIDYLNNISNLNKKSISINIGSGCNRKCSFCPIANSPVDYRPFENVFAEINDLVNNSNVRHFHIENHSFTCNMNYVRLFCEELIKRFSAVDYTWSCFIIPENLENNLDVLDLMQKSKLSRLEIGFENRNETILSDLNITDSYQITCAIISKSLELRIPSIAINYIVGSYTESIETLNETRNSMLEFVDMSNGICDINISYYTPMKLSEYDRFCECIQDRIDIAIIPQNLKEGDLIVWKQETVNEITFCREQVIHKLGIDVLYKHLLLSSKNVITQLTTDFLLHSNLNQLFIQKKAKKFLFFSWEMQDDYEKYATYLPFWPYEREGKLFFKYPRFLNSNLKEGVISLPEDIFNILKSGIMIRDAVEQIKKLNYPGLETKEEIYDLFGQLENMQVMFYTKPLN